MPNGLKLCLVKKQGYREIEAMVAFKCGALNQSFFYKGENINLPEGTAHFVEHVMFEKENGNMSARFTNLGASVNAYTSLDTTAYYFNCYNKRDFIPCLRLLGIMVSNPEFTQRAVDKEREIIEREITMYEDDPYWQVYFKMLGCLYPSHPIKSPIAGSKSEIRRIKPENLYSLYDAYYKSNNAIVIACGDLEPDEFFDSCFNYFRLSKGEELDLNTNNINCNDEINNKNEIKLSLGEPVYAIGFRDMLNLSPLEGIIDTRILLNIIIGRSSELYSRLYKEGLTITPPSLDYVYCNNVSTAFITGTSSDPKKIFELLINEIDCLINSGIKKEDLDLSIAKTKGNLYANMDNLDFCCSFIADNFTKSIKTLDFFHKYDTINSEELLNRLKFNFKRDNACLSVANPL